MRRISSTLILWWYKGVGLWFLAAVAVGGFFAVPYFVARGQLPAAWLLAPPLLTVLGAAYIRKFVLPLADEVFDDGNALVIRHRGQTSRLPLREIEDVRYSLVFDPPRIVLQTARGDKKEEVAFMPCLNIGMCFFRRHPLVDALKSRIGTSAQ